MYIYLYQKVVSKVWERWWVCLVFALFFLFVIARESKRSFGFFFGFSLSLFFLMLFFFVFFFLFIYFFYLFWSVHRRGFVLVLQFEVFFLPFLPFLPFLRVSDIVIVVVVVVFWFMLSTMIASDTIPSFFYLLLSFLLFFFFDFCIRINVEMGTNFIVLTYTKRICARLVLVPN